MLLLCQHLRYSLNVLIVLAIRRTGAYDGSLLSQCLARTDNSHVQITAQRCEGAVNAAQAVLRGGDAQFALLDLLTRVCDVVLKRLSINLACIVVTGAVLRSAPSHKGLPGAGARYRVACFAGKPAPTMNRAGIFKF